MHGDAGEEMNGLNLRNGDVLSGAALTALGTYIVIQSSIWPYYGFDGPGPGFFPIWYGILMIALALGLIVSAARKPRDENADPFFTIGTWRAMLVWLALVVSLVVMAWLGFCLGFTLFTVFVVSYVLKRPWLTGILTGAVSAAGFYILFWEVLGVQLPVGPWGF
jgi:putative tricarboxylic transport membrane protein